MDVPALKVSARDLLNDASHSPTVADVRLRSCSMLDVPARTYLQHFGDDPGGLWCLAKGALAVEMAPGTRDPQMSYLLLPPVWLGEGGIIVDAPRSVGVSTTRRSVLLHLPADRFSRIARDEPLIWRWVAKVQKENFERAMGMVDALMVRSTRARVVAVLMQLGGRLGHSSKAPRVLDMTQAQLAAIVNVSRSALSPVLKSLAAKGVIELGHATITINEPAGLRKLAR